MKNQSLIRKMYSYQFWAIVLIIIGITISVTYIYLLFKGGSINLSEKINITDFSAFGDFIGGVIGSIWTLAGVFLFFQALREQRKDTETNINLLKTQIEGLETTKKTADEQGKLLKIQQFEATFFSLFKFFSELTTNLETHQIKDDSVTKELIKGKNVFSNIVERLHKATKGEKNVGQWTDLYALREYEIVYAEMEEILQPYFGILYRLLKIINDTDFEIEEQYKYSKTIRACLINSELLVMHYHRQRFINSEFIDLLKKYNLLKNLPISIRPEFMSHKNELDALNRPNDPRPINLYSIATTLHRCLLEAILDSKHEGRELIFLALISINVKKVDATITVRIEIPTDKFLKELHKKSWEGTFEKFDEIPYAYVIQKLRNYKFCELIKELMFAEMVVDNYNYYVIEQRNILSSLYSVKENIFESKNQNDKVFECEFTFHKPEKIWVQYDFDDLKEQIKRSREGITT
jgi:hypothetical protein